MSDDSSSSGSAERRQPRTIGGPLVLLGLLVISIALMVFFVVMYQGMGRAKESLPADHPLRSSTSRPAEHITGGDE
mgnify:CR=1 FL=1